MLWLHMGMPKTGTTALQAYVRKNKDPLANSGLRYLEAGRRRLGGKGRLAISHNIIAFHINQTDEPMDTLREAVALEYDAHRDQNCLMSSEMFLSCDLNRLAEVFAEIPARDLRILFYCRRYSDFFEADYKQRAKNGRLKVGASEYVRDRLSRIESDPSSFSFTEKTHRIRQAFPGVQVIPMLYDRSSMVNGHVVDDFMSHIGVSVPQDAQADRPANTSQSRAASEAFGIVSRAMGRKESRRLRRIVSDDPVMIRRRDVLEADERVWLDSHMAVHDAPFQQEFFPDRPQLFTPVDLSDDDRAFRRDTAEEYLALQRATEIVFRMALSA